MSSNVIEAAAGHRQEIFAAISSASGTDDAVKAVSHLLAVSADEAREVLRAPLESFVGATPEQPEASSPSSFALHPFRDSDEHNALYKARSTDASSATGGTWDESRTEQERREGLKRIDAESAMWFVAVDGARGIVLRLAVCSPWGPPRTSIGARGRVRGVTYKIVMGPCSADHRLAAPCTESSKQPRCGVKNKMPLPRAHACSTTSAPCTTLTGVCLSQRRGNSATMRPACPTADRTCAKLYPACALLAAKRRR